MKKQDATRPLQEGKQGRGTTPLEPVPVPVPVRTAGVLAAALRDVGQQRQNNQDSVYALVSSIPRGEGDTTLGLFLVADGMGGHAAGEVASRIALVSVVRYVLADLLVPALDEAFSNGIQSVVVGAVEEANRAIWEYARSYGLDLGTTCTMALVLGRTVYIGHVGDSRAYLLDQQGLRPLTDDHSTVGRLIQLGQLDYEDTREHPLRSQLYRTVGQSPQVTVDFAQYPLGEASHLLLCSDGLWSSIDEAAMQAAILKAPSPQDACRTLIDLANAAGGDDNISAVVVQL
jgi:serine/threonine protein phosphatase PrpC